MITIILAAGNNKRFKGKHKGALKARDGRTVLENIVDNLDANPVFLIAQRKHRRQLKKVVDKLFPPGSKKLLIHAWLGKPTSGPLDTLWKAEKWIKALLEAQDNGDTSIVISYCDVLLKRKYFNRFIQACENHETGIVIFQSDDERFGKSLVWEGFKNSGVFYFKSGKKMLEKLEKSEKLPEYGVPVLVHSLTTNFSFVCNEVIDIGIPEDYEEYING